jgi:hypothetical protein
LTITEDQVLTLEPEVVPSEQPAEPTVEKQIEPAPVVTTTKPAVLPEYSMGLILPEEQVQPVVAPAEPVAAPAEPVAAPAEPVATPAEPTAAPSEPQAGQALFLSGYEVQSASSFSYLAILSFMFLILVAVAFAVRRNLKSKSASTEEMNLNEYLLLRA